MAIADLIASLQGNPYFGAGFGLAGLGALAATARKASQFGMVLFRRHYVLTMEVTSRDKSYPWLLNWISRNAKHTQHMSVETFLHKTESGTLKAKFDYVPAPGDHFFWHRNLYIKVERTREKQMIDMERGAPFETVRLTTLGRQRQLFFDILDEARDDALKTEEGKTVIYTAFANEWRQFGYPRKKRPLDSVILDRGIAERIITDIKEFVDNPQWYHDRGIPHRRGYLLHGPPGGGKSSFISALAGALEYSICILSLNDIGLSNDRLNYLLTVAPQHSIVLLEDIDAAFLNRDIDTTQGKYQGASFVTFSGLLNALDGVASSEGRIVFMTTNHLDKLDPALIRPGRVDLKECIGHSTEYQQEKMYQRFYPHLPLEKSREFSGKVASFNRPTSMAQVQGFFMRNKEDGLFVIDHAEQIWD